MQRKIVLIHGHPDPAGAHLCDALAESYADGARGSGHEVRVIKTALLDLPYIRNQADWLAPTTNPQVRAAQDDIRWAEHLVIIYPLWLGDMPAVLKGFLEHLSSGGSMMEITPQGKWLPKMKGKSARIIVTMGMPVVVYRWFFFAHSLKNLERNILKFGGVAPIRETLLGMVDGPARAAARSGWLSDMRRLGAAGI